MAMRDDTITPFARLLLHHRIAAGLTQEKLAEKTADNAHGASGLSSQAIAAIERGLRKAPRQETVEMLADALNLTGNDRAHFFWEADKLRPRKKSPSDTPFAATGDASQYLPRPAPADAIIPETGGPPADETYLLPSLPECFVGRETELEWLTDRLRRGITTGITAVKGIGGVGKTSLAAMAIHVLRAEGRFTGGVGVNICQGKTDPIQVIREVLARFEPQRHLPSDTMEMPLHDTAFRLLGNKDVLIVLDNVEPELDIETVVKPFQAAKATILLTSRSYLPVGESLDLQLLTSDQARELFCWHYGKSSINDFGSADAAAIARIVENLGAHTLAVKVAAHYARSSRRSLTILADELRTPHEVEKITDTINFVFQHSFEALLPTSQQLFAALGAFATLEFSRNAAKALAKTLGHARPGACVDNLIERALVEPAELDGLLPGSDTERLRLHPLLQAFAIEQLALLPSEFDTMVRQTLAAYYADYAGGPKRVALGPDENNITAALIYAHECQLHELVAKICLGMQLFWRDYGRAAQSEEYVFWGITAAELVTDVSNTQEARQMLATLRLARVRFLRLTGKLGEAERLAQLVLPTFRDADNLHGTAGTLTVLGNIARDKGAYEQARTYLREALSIFQSDQVQDFAGQGIVLSFLGQASQRLGDIETSDQELQQSIDAYREINDQWGIGLARLLLGNNSIQRGRFQEAIPLYHDVLEFYQSVDSRRSVGVGLSALGVIALNLGNLAEAEQHFHQSLKARCDSRDRRGEAVDYTFLGRLTAVQERFAESSSAFVKALAIWKEIDDPRGNGWALSEQAQVALSRDKLDEADSLLERSLALRWKVGDQAGIAIDLRISAEVALRRGNTAMASDLLQQAAAIATTVKDRPEQARIRLVRGMVAAACGNLDRAESHYRASLSLASELGIRREMAQTQELLGRLLVERREVDEGCQLLSHAATNYAHAGIPAAKRMRELMVQLGCSVDI